MQTHRQTSEGKFLNRKQIIYEVYEVQVCQELTDGDKENQDYKLRILINETLGAKLNKSYRINRNLKKNKKTPQNSGFNSTGSVEAFNAFNAGGGGEV